MLADFAISNEQVLRDWEVDQSLYGKYDLSGIKDSENEPCPRVWDPVHMCWSDSWKEKLYDVEVNYYDQQYDLMAFRLSSQDKLPEPRYISDIVNFGIANPELATNAVAELLEQLYHTDKYQVMITTDGYNQWFQPSRLTSFRYQNNRHARGLIPPHDLALVRLLMRFDGNFMRNGVKLAATTHKHEFNVICDPVKDMDFYDGYHCRMSNLTLNDFRNAMDYYAITCWMHESLTDPEWQLENLFMETQGNWAKFRQQREKALRIYY